MNGRINQSRREQARAKRVRVCQMQKNILIMMVALICIIAGVIIGSTLLSSSRAKASNEDVLYKYYTSIEVKQGDTLWTIADTYKTDDSVTKDDYIREVMHMNGLQNETIHAGDFLTVAYYSEEFK